MAKKSFTLTPTIVVIACEILLAISFGAARSFSNNPPVFLDWFEILTLVAFVILLGINLGMRHAARSFAHTWWNWVTLTILVIVFIAALIAGDPIKKTHAEAISFTRGQQEAAERGYDLAVEFTNGNKSEAEVAKEINRLPKEVRDVASKAVAEVVKSRDKPKTAEEIVTTAVPTIPVTVGSWTCSPAGCSFADSTYIWTISLFDLIMAAVLNGVIMLMAVWVVNSTPKRRKAK